MKPQFCLTKSIATLIAGTLVLTARVDALPKGENVRSGNANFERAGNRLNIRAGDRTIIDYRSFNISRGEKVQFIQPGRNSTVLNRVIERNPSKIFGTMEANGRVVLMNPYGIFFGNGAVINVGSLIAAAGNMSDSDFLAGNGNVSLSGSVINRGNITAIDGVSLYGTKVQNSGTITSQAGAIEMLAGSQVYIGENGGNIFAGGAINAPKPRVVNRAASVENTGKLAAPKVTLAAGDAYGLAVAHSGTIQSADVTLQAPKAQVVVSGRVDASNRTAGAKGGKVKFLGDKVTLRNAVVDASGDAGGGEVLVGGDFQGGNGVQTAKQTSIDSNSAIVADAVTSGDGGRVIVWADGKTTYTGTISARGGSTGGDGGFVEVSGANVLDFRGQVDTSAPAGNTGTLLLDPLNITIDQSGANGSLVGGAGSSDGNANTYSFNEDPAATSNIRPSFLAGLNATVTLQAKNDITFAAGGDGLVQLTQAGAGFIAQAGGNITFLAGSGITTNGGLISLTANDTSAGSVPTGTGSIIGAANLTTTGNNATFAPGGNITLTIGGGTGSVSVGNLNTRGGGGVAGNGVVGGAGGNVSITSAGTITAGTITTTGGAGGNANGNNTGGVGGAAGTISLTAGGSGSGAITVGAVAATGGAGGNSGGGAGTAGSGGAGGTITFTSNGGGLTGTTFSSAGGAAGNPNGGTAGTAGTGAITTLSGLGAGDVTVTTVTSGGANVTLTSRDALNVGAITAGAGAINLSANQDGAGAQGFAQTNNTTISGGTVTVTVNTGAGAGTGGAIVSNLTATGALSIGTSNLAGTAGGSITRTATSLLQGSTVSLSTGTDTIGTLANPINLAADQTGVTIVTHTAAGDVFLDDTASLTIGPVTLTGGDLTVNTGDGGTLTVGGAIQTGGGAVTLTADDALALGASIDAGVGVVTLTANTDGTNNTQGITQTAGTIAGGGIVLTTNTLNGTGTGAIGSSGAPIRFAAGQAVTATTFGGDLFLEANGALTVTSASTSDTSGTNPGPAGIISIKTTGAGNLTINSLSAVAGNRTNNGDGFDGGTVTIDSAGLLSINNFVTSGGNANGGGNDGGDAGSVSVFSLGDVTIGAGGFVAVGGNGVGGGNGGNGGEVTIDARNLLLVPQNITFNGDAASFGFRTTGGVPGNTSGTSLGGEIELTGNVTINGRLSPGGDGVLNTNSASTRADAAVLMKVHGNLTIDGGATLFLTLEDNTPGVNQDQIQVDGTTTLVDPDAGGPLLGPVLTGIAKAFATDDLPITIIDGVLGVTGQFSVDPVKISGQNFSVDITGLPFSDVSLKRELTEWFWDGGDGNDSNWSSEDNWVGDDGIPGSGDIVHFVGNAARLNPFVDINTVKLKTIFFDLDDSVLVNPAPPTPTASYTITGSPIALVNTTTGLVVSVNSAAGQTLDLPIQLQGNSSFSVQQGSLTMGANSSIVSSGGAFSLTVNRGAGAGGTLVLAGNIGGDKRDGGGVSLSHEGSNYNLSTGGADTRLQSLTVDLPTIELGNAANPNATVTFNTIGAQTFGYTTGTIASGVQFIGDSLVLRDFTTPVNPGAAFGPKVGGTPYDFSLFVGANGSTVSIPTQFTAPAGLIRTLVIGGKNADVGLVQYNLAGPLTTMGAQVYFAAVNLVGNAAITTGLAGVNTIGLDPGLGLALLAGTNSDSAATPRNLTINSSGLIWVAGDVGAGANGTTLDGQEVDDRPLGSINFSGTGPTHLGGNSGADFSLVTARQAAITTGDQTFGGAVSLDIDTKLVVVNGAPVEGNITFNSTIDSVGGTFSLTASTGADEVFNGAIGKAGELASLTTDAVGTPGGTARFNMLATGAGNRGGVNLTGALTVNDTANFGVAGSTSATNPSVVTGLGGGTGGQTYNGVFLSQDTVLADASGEDITFNSFVNGGFSLAVNTQGNEVFNGPIGKFGAIASLTTDDAAAPASDRTGGSTQFNMNAVGLFGRAGVNVINGVLINDAVVFNVAGSTSAFNPTVVTGLGGGAGGQVYNGAVTLSQNTVLADANAQNITFDSTINGGFALAVNTQGNEIFNDTVGKTTALTSLVLDDAAAPASDQAGGSTLFNMSALGAGNRAGITLTGGLIANSAVVFNVGGSSSATNPSVLTGFGGGLAGQTYNGAVALSQNTVLADENAQTIRFNGTVDGAFSLSVNTRGDEIFAGAVGKGAALTTLTTDNPAAPASDRAGGTAFFSMNAVGIGNRAGVNVRGPVTINDAANFAVVGSTSGLNPSVLTGLAGGTGGQNYLGNVTLAQNTVLADENSQDIIFSGAIDGASSLFVNTRGDEVFEGAIGKTVALENLVTDDFFAPATDRVGGSAQFNMDALGGANVGAVNTTGLVLINDLVEFNVTNASLVNPSVLSSIGGGFGGQFYLGAATLGADTVLTDANARDITFSFAVDSDAAATPRSLTVNTAGNEVFNARLGGNFALGALLTDANVPVGAGLGKTIFNFAGTVANPTVRTVNDGTQTGVQIYNDTVELRADAVLSSTSQGAGTVGGDIIFQKTVDSDSALTPWTLEVNTTGNEVFNARLGGTFKLGGLLTDSNVAPGTGQGTTIFAFAGSLLAPTVSTVNDGTHSGVQIYNGAVELQNDAVLAGFFQAPALVGPNITFLNTVDSNAAATPWSLTVNTTGDQVFAARVGGLFKLGGLFTDIDVAPGAGLGKTIFNFAGTTASPTVSTVADGTHSGAQIYNDAFELQNDAFLASFSQGAATSGGDITFRRTVDSNSVATPWTLEVNTTGDEVFNARVGGIFKLGGLRTDADVAAGMGVGRTIFNFPGTFLAPTVSTVNDGGAQTGDQIYNDAVLLRNDAVLTSYVQGGATTGGNIAFERTIDSDAVLTPRSLTVNTSGNGIFGGRVGGTFMLGSLVTDGDLAPGTGLGKTIFKFAGNLLSPSVMTVNDGIHSGVQIYNDAVELQNNTVLTGLFQGAALVGGNITFHQTVDSDSAATPWALTANTTGSQIFNGQVGGTFRLGGLVTDADAAPGLGLGKTIFTFAGTTAAPTVSTVNDGTQSGVQNYNDAVELRNDTVLSSFFQGAVTNGGSIVFQSTVDSDAALTPRRLEVNTGALTAFQANVGANLPLFSLLTDDAAAANYEKGNLTGERTEIGKTGFAGDVRVVTIDGQVYNDPVVIPLPNQFRAELESTGNAIITFEKSIDGPGGILIKTAGDTTFKGKLGAVVTLGSIATSGGGKTIVATPTLRSVNQQTYDDDVILNNTATFSSTAGGTISFNRTVFGKTATADLNIQTAGDAFLRGNVSVARLDAKVAGTTTLGSPGTPSAVTTTGFQRFTGNVTAVGLPATIKNELYSTKSKEFTVGGLLTVESGAHFLVKSGPVALTGGALNNGILSVFGTGNFMAGAAVTGAGILEVQVGTNNASFAKEVTQKTIKVSGNLVTIGDANATGGELNLAADTLLRLTGKTYKASGDIFFNPEGSTLLPGLFAPAGIGDATILKENAGNLTVDAGGDFTMGPGEKFLVDNGALTIRADKATIGDLAAFTTLTVKAGSIVLQGREAQDIDNNGREDLGLGFVAQVIDFSNADLSFAAGTPQVATFATQTGAPRGVRRNISNKGITFVTMDDLPDQFHEPGEGILPGGFGSTSLLQPIANGVRTSEATETQTIVLDSRPEPITFEQSTTLTAAVKEALDRMRIRPRDATAEENESLSLLRGLFRQPIEGQALLEDDDYKVVVNRLVNEEVELVLEAYLTLMSSYFEKWDTKNGPRPSPSDFLELAATGQIKGAPTLADVYDKSELLAVRLDELVQVFRKDDPGRDLGEFLKWLTDQRADKEMGEKAKYVADNLDNLARLIDRLGKIGLTRKELELSKQFVLQSIAGNYPDLVEKLAGPAAPVAAPIPVPIAKVVSNPNVSNPGALPPVDGAPTATPDQPTVQPPPAGTDVPPPPPSDVPPPPPGDAAPANPAPSVPEPAPGPGSPAPANPDAVPLPPDAVPEPPAAPGN